MTNEQDLRFLQLWDLYSGLLTPTQRAITDLYFNYDLSISEIAVEKGITRQGVQECLKTCKRQLEDYENALHFSKRLEELSAEVQKLKDILAKEHTAEQITALKNTDKV